MEQSRIDDYSHTEAMKRAKRANFSRDSLPSRRKGGRSRDLEPESESESDSESESASADEEASDTESESGGGGESENGSPSGGDEWRRERRGEVDKIVEVRSPTSKGGKR